MTDVHMYLERVRRHYEGAVKTYDPISLRELAHALRIWTELDAKLPEILPKVNSTIAFKSATPGRRLVRRVRGERFIFAYMPSGVVTYAHAGRVVSIPDTEKLPKGRPVNSGARVMLQADGSLLLKNFFFIAMDIDDDINRAIDNEVVARCNYGQWLRAEVVKMSYPNESGNLEVFTISREMMIKRVANTMDGSHAAVAQEENTNRFDAPIHHLLSYTVGGLPLPYFIVLNAAQDLIKLVPQFMAK